MQLAIDKSFNEQNILVNHAHNVLKQGDKLVNRAHDLLKQGDELVSRGNVLLTCGLDIHLHLHLVIWQTLLSKATYNWGVHKAIHLEEAIRQRKCS